MAKPGRKALIKVSGTATAFTGEATTNQGDNKTYQLTDAAKRVWDMTATITVKVGGVPTGESYTLNRLDGKVIFTGADPGRAAVTLDGQYLPLSVAAQSKEYGYTLQGDNRDSTSFQDNWKKRKQGLLDYTGSLSRWFVDTYFASTLLADTVKVLEFYSDGSLAPDLKVWARLNSAEMKSVVAGLVEETVNFEGTTDTDGRMVSI